MTVATPPNDDTKALFRILADRKWHNYIEVRAEIARQVGPGRALRKYLEGVEIRRRLRYGGDPTYGPTIPEDEQIEIGARSCAQIAISGWKKSGALMSRGEGRDKEICVKPGFTSWGIPGFEPTASQSDQDPGEETQGYPEVPQADSVASEVPARSPDEVSVAEQLGQWEPETAVEPEPGPVSPGPAESEQTRVFAVDDSGQWHRAPEPDVLDGPGNAAWIPGVIPVPPESPVACPRCGLAVADREVHQRWHEDPQEPDKAPELSLLDASQLSDLLRKGLVDVLDPLQQNMENYFAERFAELERQILILQRGYWKLTFTDEKLRTK